MSFNGRCVFPTPLDDLSLDTISTGCKMAKMLVLIEIADHRNTMDIYLINFPSDEQRLLWTRNDIPKCHDKIPSTFGYHRNRVAAKLSNVLSKELSPFNSILR